MRTFMRDIKIKGVKNLKEPVELTFANKEIKNFESLKENNIKAIYGPNGSGKTAIVHAFAILKELLMNRNYLQDSLNIKTLATLMNKKCRSIEISTTFFVEGNNKEILIYSYEGVITYSQGSFYLSSEKYAYKTSEYGKERILLATKDGKIKGQKENESIGEQFINLLDKSSFLSLLGNKIFMKQNTEGLETFGPLIFPFFELINSVFTILEFGDTYFDLYFRKPEDAIKEGQRFADYLLELDTFKEDRFNFTRIPEEELVEYEKNLKKQEKFLKIFKTNVKGLGFEKKLALSTGKKKYYHVSEYVEYDDYQIDLELESVGIKKLLHLFEAIKVLNEGALLVIDEFDSHINDVYLVKLLEFISNYTTGQLIFTTHNTSPMDLLKGRKYALDFLSISGEISSWTQIGNYSASKTYHKGMIKKLPFNVSAESFIGVFANED